MPNAPCCFPVLAGIDFTSRPRPAKPITLALGRSVAGGVALQEMQLLPHFAALAAWLRSPGPWLGAFDFPFGLPRELIVHLGWPLVWPDLIAHYACLPREQIRSTFQAFCDSRPSGRKFAHRACDGPAGSSPSMKWVNPPVAFMLHAGAPLLLASGVHLPGLHQGDRSRVALEGYPGLLARELIGAQSYKSDAKAHQDEPRREARRRMIDALEQGRTRLALRLVLSPAQRDALIADASADALDAVLCMVQAAWSASRPNYGLPEGVDPLEGWIATAT
ncbi:MAG: DUF429 domain-containing protein [Burkholderiales bacterium]|nr:DUF429 domain-containing protein [Burkholderiales bacterium]